MPDTSHLENLFGRIAVACGYVKSAEIERAVEVQKRSDDKRHLGHILIEMGKLSEEQLMTVLAVQREQRTREERSAPVRQAAATLGELAVAHGWASWGQIHECIEEQARLERFRLFMRLGEVMVSRRVLDVSKVLALLGQQQLTILGCPGCFSRYNVAKYDVAKREHCPKCGTQLEIPVTIDTVKVDGEIGVRG